MIQAESKRRRGAAARLIGACLLVATALVVAGFGAAAPARAGTAVYTADSMAIEGYDPVAYFIDGRPVEGKAEYSHEWMGATWRFASAAHRDTFAADPERYAPQYGGFCAWAVSQGYTAEIDPAAWHIEGGRLYLNYSKSVQARWAQDIPGNIAKADGHWPAIRADLAAK